MTAARGDASLVRGGASMAVGTIASRATGFLRTVVLLSALGLTGVNDAYNTGNTIPNIVYDLLLGGVLSSVLVPTLVRAGREDDDGGEAFLSSVFTLVVVALVVVTVLGELAAPLLMRAYLSDKIHGDERSLAITFTRLFLPQLLFYALTALFSAALTIKGRFGAVGFAPTINNLVVIAVALAFLATPRAGLHRGLAHLSNGQTLLLGLGTTAGVVAMALALLPSLARAGIRLRWRWEISDPRLRQTARLGGWVFGYAVSNQIGYVVISNLATARPGDQTTYATAYQLFQLPYAIVTVSVLSAVMPGLSASALDGDQRGVVGQLSRALRLSGILLVPATLGLVVLAHPIAQAIRFGHASTAGTAGIGDALAVFAVGLVPFSVYLLVLRVFYAQHDSRTPALINVWANLTNIVADVVAVSVLPGSDRVPGLAGGFVLSYVVGTALAVRRLRRPMGGLDGFRVVRTFVRVTIAGALGAALAGGVAASLRSVAGSGTAGSLLAVVVAAVVGTAAYLWVARRMRVGELTALVALVRR